MTGRKGPRPIAAQAERTMSGPKLKSFAALAGFLLLAACFRWTENVERGGYAFSKYRVDDHSGVHIGILAEDAAANGFLCQAGGWAHFNHDWSLGACFLAAPYEMENATIPAGTWVMPRADRLVVAFPEDTPCQGFVCSGTGGTKGTHTVYYPDGRLKSFFPPEHTQMGEVLCKATPLVSIDLYRNGQLQRCVAAAGGQINGIPFARNDTIELDAAGQRL